MSSPPDAFQLPQELSEGIVLEECIEGEFGDYNPEDYSAESDSESDVTSISPEWEHFEDEDIEDGIDVEQIATAGLLAIRILIVHCLFTQ